MQQMYFVSSFSINSTSITNYKPVEVTAPEKIHFHGVLTSYLQGIYRGENPITFEQSLDLIVQLNLITPKDPSHLSHNPLEIEMVRITMDQKRATIENFPSFSEPTPFEVALSPFENETITEKMLPRSYYYLEITILIRPHDSTFTMPIFNTTFPARVNLKSEDDSL